MKPKTMMLLGVALVCGVAAAYMTSQVLTQQKKEVEVLVAKGKYNQWTAIKEPDSMFEKKKVLESDAPKTRIQKIEDLKDRVLLKTIEPGQPITAEDLQGKDRASMEALLLPGKVAMAIKSNAADAAGGFVLPGSRVDVIQTTRGDQRNPASSSFVLQNVLVRAVDLLPIRPEDKPGMVPAHITFELNREQALKLAIVRDSGNLILVLRPFGDETVKESDTPPPPPPPPPLPSKTDEQPSEGPAKTKPKELEAKPMVIVSGANWDRHWYEKGADGKYRFVRSDSNRDGGAAKAPGAPPPEGPPPGDEPPKDQPRERPEGVK